jgi:hypothetical protein
MGVKRVAYDLNRQNMEDRMMKKLIKVLFLFIFIVGCLYLRGGTHFLTVPFYGSSY